MLVIKENVSNRLVINKSEFITYLYQIDSVNQIDEYLNFIKSKYPDATHYCYAYILDSFQKCSDDKEPAGTAGLPMLDILKKKDLNHILCIVVRYFGGIKLGTGGLLRAYVSSVTEALNNTDILDKHIGKEISIISDYTNQKLLDQLLNKYEYTKKYHDTITYNVVVDDEVIAQLEMNKIKYTYIKDNFITTKKT